MQSIKARRRASAAAAVASSTGAAAQQPQSSSGTTTYYASLLGSIVPPLQPSSPIRFARSPTSYQNMMMNRKNDALAGVKDKENMSSVGNSNIVIHRDTTGSKSIKQKASRGTTAVSTSTRKKKDASSSSSSKRQWSVSSKNQTPGIGKTI
jgi:hypothetical protein